MKPCSKCGQEHERDGQRYCYACHAEWMRKNRLRHSQLPEQARLRANARAYANVYLKRGKLKREACSCGDYNSQMHHADYDKPLEVTWLCRKCHLELHQNG